MKRIIKLLLVGLLIVAGVFVVALGIRQHGRSRSDAAASSSVSDTLPPASAPVVPLENILHATIVEIQDDDTLIVEDSKHGRITLRIGPETRIWKGGWERDRPIEVGDYFWGYGEPSEEGTVWLAEQMEVNIINLRGHIVETTNTADGVDVQLKEVHDGQVYLVHITAESPVVSDVIGERDMPFGETGLELVAGDSLQVVGLKLKDGSVLATSVFY